MPFRSEPVEAAVADVFGTLPVVVAVNRFTDDTDNEVKLLEKISVDAGAEAAELAQQVGLRVYTIGIGAESMDVSSLIGGRRAINPSADLDEETLTAIAGQTGGQYFRATDTASLQDIYALLDELEPVEEPESGFRPVKSYYYWPLGFAFALCLGLCLASLLERVILKRRAEVHAHAR